MIFLITLLSLCFHPIHGQEHMKYYFGDKIEIRLTGGLGVHEGNIELRNVTGVSRGNWKHICDDEWDMRDAKVVCRQLGYAHALKATTKTKFRTYYTYHIVIPYLLTHVMCKGDEDRIENCENGERRPEKCILSTNAAGVVCTNVTKHVQTKPKPSEASGNQAGDIQVRLVGKSKHGFISSGYLEVFYDGVWGAVCADRWTHTDSFVACGNLGYPDAEYRYRYRYSSYSRRNYQARVYWMNNVRCRGLESKLVECDHDGWRRHVCRSHSPVHLNCKRSPFLRHNRFDKALLSKHNLRIRSGYRHSEGRVEVLHDGEWGSICHDNWSIRNANVFCRQIGFGSAFEATHHASFGQGSGKVWMDEVKCKGNEKNIKRCKHEGWGRNDCGHKEDAGVKCHHPYGEYDDRVRLRGSNDTLKGHIEVMHDGKWAGVCGIGFGYREATVICRQLGLGYPQKALSTTKLGMVRDFAMFSVRCSGDELSIFHCSYLTKRTGRACRYHDIAAVECSPLAPDLVIDIEELRNSIEVDMKTLSWLRCAFEEGCLGVDARYYNIAPDMYMRTLLRFSARFWNRGTTDFRPTVRPENWEWHSCHKHFHSMERFADYDITDYRGNKVGEGHKASFCLEDYECDKGVTPVYACGKGERRPQGVKVNCADNYLKHLDCQWVDITMLEYGQYKLRVVLNPQNLVYETDYSNNIASCEIAYLSPSNVTVGACRIDPCEQMSHGGKGSGACCKFPFVFQGKQYHTCTTDSKKMNVKFEKLWCATTSNYDKDGLWGLCG